ncbi:2-oxo-4-hydroxy-4-carboxy-5-ureidoimidazoline decarboxylase [Paenibacillus campi]|uniref:2-oxo-4-hydroxy-4-carboxy-5-ureidoimidazoline decarboxylase n=1 Tax=Paenibacillus campi TaxID=3106031 RepID=UPI002AFE72A7|nr:2-oxo-4-hydroxy-4-carboxy-5-ureidoimidazoline decarboxylase [Paenibacillus sp. SGZ-1009]
MELTSQPWQSWTKEQFTTQFSGLYEHSPWVAEGAWTKAPFSSLQDVLAKMKAVVDEAGTEKQLELLRQHPDLGARIQMTEHSQSEQAGAGLDNLTAEQYEKLSRLNREYTATYQFPFILAVKGKHAAQILAIMEQRNGQPWEQEFATALAQVHTIVGLRMHDWAERAGLNV